MNKPLRIGAVLSLSLTAISSVFAQTVYVLGRPTGPTTITRFGTLNLATGAYAKIADLSINLQGITTGAGGTLYGAGGDFEQFLYKVSSNGVETLVGDTGRSLANGSNTGFGSAQDGTLYLRQGSSLYSLASSNGIASLVGNMGVGPSGQFAGDASGKLYTFVQGFSEGVYSVNRTTGAATMVASSSFSQPLVNVGGTMYTMTTGIGNPSIYTVSTTNGSQQFLARYDTNAAGFIYSAAPSAVPEPCALVGLGVGVLAYCRRSGRRSLVRGRRSLSH